MYTRRSWREKMDNPNLPKVVDIPPAWQKRCGPGSMLLPSPRQVEALIRTVPKGRLITVTRIREILAAEHMTSIACPLVTCWWSRVRSSRTDSTAVRKRRSSPAGSAARPRGCAPKATASCPRRASVRRAWQWRRGIWRGPSRAA